MKSEIKSKNGIPTLFVEGKETDFTAYVTYFTENNNYKNFAEAGYHLYSVCAYFCYQPINESSGFTPASMGIFEQKDAPDYSEFDRDINQLLAIDPAAMIFPRIYLSMPLWWVKEHPEECAVGDDLVTAEGREMLFSEKFRRQGAELLRCFITHVQAMPYADSIIGYQISGGRTQEWFHFQRDPMPDAKSFPYFADYMKKNHPAFAVTEEAYIAEKYERYYLDFLNDSVADTVDFFAKTAKELVNASQIIGAFYGYTMEDNTPKSGSHSLHKLLDSPYIDFFCSPISYHECRPLGKEWVSMVPENSVRLHGKAYVTEADIRTHLSKYPDECRKNIKIKNLYRGPIWLGGPTEQLARYQVRKGFAKMLCTCHAFWWFDMWGGWYDCPAMMQDMKRYKEISALPMQNPPFTKAKVAVLADEKMFLRIPTELCQRAFCQVLGVSGVAYDLYLLSDFERIKNDYSVIFLPPRDADTHYDDIKKECDRLGIVYGLGCELTVEEIRAIAQKGGVTPMGESGTCTYIGNGFAALHTSKAGKQTITLPEAVSCTSLLGQPITQEGNKITCTLDQYDTLILQLQPVTV